jgi:ketosteroid isomerase-like protein
MSGENVELVRRIYDAAARRDAAAPFEIYAEDIVWDLSQTSRAVLYEQPIYVGHEAVRRMWRESLTAFAEVDFDLEGLTDAAEHVLAVVRERATGRASHAPGRSGALRGLDPRCRQGDPPTDLR